MIEGHTEVPQADMRTGPELACHSPSEGHQITIASILIETFKIIQKTVRRDGESCAKPSAILMKMLSDFFKNLLKH